MAYLEVLFNLKDKAAVITGGSGILGSAMAEGLLNAGARVALLARDAEKLKSRVESLRSGNRSVIGLVCNVLDEGQVQAAKNEILDKFGCIDILINAAGGHVPGAVIGTDQVVFDLDIANFRKVTDLNLLGTVIPTLIFGKAMADQKSGSIINISSMAARRAITRVVGYSVAKAGVENFTRWMAMEMAHKYGDGIRVNAIAPGFFLTDQNQSILINPDGSLTERSKAILKMTPFNRFGNPEELIGTVLWLAGGAASFVTGAVIPVDGGFSPFSGV